MNYRNKSILLVGFISLMATDHTSLRFLDDLFGSLVQMRNEDGSLTSQGKVMKSVFFMVIANMVLSQCSNK